jgi:hypothetical protein
MFGNPVWARSAPAPAFPVQTREPEPRVPPYDFFAGVSPDSDQGGVTPFIRA